MAVKTKRMQRNVLVFDTLKIDKLEVLKVSINLTINVFETKLDFDKLDKDFFSINKEILKNFVFF
jgi:hypothetical protein